MCSSLIWRWGVCQFPTGRLVNSGRLLASVFEGPTRLYVYEIGQSLARFLLGGLLSALTPFSIFSVFFYFICIFGQFSLCFIRRLSQAIEAAKVDKTDKPFNEMKIISIDIS